MEQSRAMLSGELGLPSVEPPSLTLTAIGRDEVERNPIFDALVSSEGEISGLVAYSLYKQNKRSWLDDFKKMTGRLPTDAEARSYIIGESTERRLATYRQMAQITLGQNPIRPASPMSVAPTSPVAVALWALAILVALGIIGYALRAFNLTGGK